MSHSYLFCYTIIHSFIHSFIIMLKQHNTKYSNHWQHAYYSSVLHIKKHIVKHYQSFTNHFQQSAATIFHISVYNVQFSIYFPWEHDHHMISMFPDGCTEKAHMCVSVAGHMTQFQPMRFQYSSWWYDNMSYSHGELTPSISSAILNGHLWQTSSFWLTDRNTWEMCKIKIILKIKFHKKAKKQQQ